MLGRREEVRILFRSLMGWLKTKRELLHNGYYFTCVALLFCGVFGGSLSLLTDALDSSLIFMLIGFLGLIMYVIQDLRRRIAFGIFLSSFFLFLLGRMAVQRIFGEPVEYTFGHEISMHIIAALFVSLLFVSIGYIVSEYFQDSRLAGYKHTVPESQSEKHLASIHLMTYLSNLRFLSLCAFYVSATVKLTQNLEVFLFIRSHGYVSYFSSFESVFPGFLSSVSSITILMFCVYLSTRPSRSQFLYPCVFFIIINVSALLTGDRGGFVLGFSLLFFYLLLRDLEKRGSWISKKTTLLVIMALPLLVFGLSFFVYIREGADIGSHGFISQIKRFFTTAGKSVDIIGYEAVYRPELPKNLYSFGGIVEFLRGNRIVSWLLPTSQYQPHTEEYALNTFYFSHAISFKIFPSMYLAGHGKGSVYIAELFHDFGYSGVIIGNFIVGVFLSSISRIGKSRPLMLGIALTVFYQVPYLARGQFTDPIMGVFNIPSALSLVMLHYLSKRGCTCVQKSNLYSRINGAEK